VFRALLKQLFIGEHARAANSRADVPTRAQKYGGSFPYDPPVRGIYGFRRKPRPDKSAHRVRRERRWSTAGISARELVRSTR
jgi:hypothetical protein